MVGHGNQSNNTPPSVGAIAGASAMSMAINDSARAARVGPYTSLATARASVGPTQAPMPWIKRYFGHQEMG